MPTTEESGQDEDSKVVEEESLTSDTEKPKNENSTMKGDISSDCSYQSVKTSDSDVIHSFERVRALI